MDIPSITLLWDFSKKTENPVIKNGVFVDSGQSITLSKTNFESSFYALNKENIFIAILGSPIINGQLCKEKTAEYVFKEGLEDNAIQNIDGEFLIIRWDQAKVELSIITDRYSAYPVYWAQNKDEFCLSYNYLQIARHCSKWTGFALRPEKAYEFFILQRLMGTDTHDNKTQILPPASILSIKAGQNAKHHKYWKPDYTKDTKASEKQLIGAFYDLLKSSVNKRISDDMGIFLSGGHDSRIIAAATNTPATCYTLSFRNNLEVNVAKKISDICGHTHVYSTIEPEFFNDTLDVATEISGGQYTTDHALFLNQSMNPIPKANVFLHGHGLDFMFQGMYLHARYYHLFGRHTYIKHFLPLPENLPKHFINHIPFRLKFNHDNYIRHDHKDHLYETVRNIYETSTTLTDNKLDQLEYLVFHNNARHYTFSNVLSKRTCGELRTPSFDNELYDFYLRLPFQYRLHANMMRGAIYKMNPRIANLPAANHNLPAGWGPYSKTAMLMGRKLLRHATFNKCFHGPKGKDRTWPDRDTYFKDHPAYFEKAMAPLHDTDFMNFLSFIDWERLKRDQNSLYTQPFYGAFLVTILSYYRFYKALGY